MNTNRPFALSIQYNPPAPTIPPIVSVSFGSRTFAPHFGESAQDFIKRVGAMDESRFVYKKPQA